MHWSDDPQAVADLAQRARKAVAARVGLEDSATAAAVVKAFEHARDLRGTDIGKARAALDALEIRHPRLVADLRPLVEKAGTLDLLQRAS